MAFRKRDMKRTAKSRLFGTCFGAIFRLVSLPYFFNIVPAKPISACDLFLLAKFYMILFFAHISILVLLCKESGRFAGLKFIFDEWC